LTSGGGERGDAELDEVEALIGHRFGDRALLERALTHASRAHEDGDPGRGNERLEFLGDAVLDLAVSELLFEAHPEADEGLLSRARARAVNQKALAGYTRALGLQRAIRLARGEQRSGGRNKASIQANAFEAVLGALYLDGGLEAVRRLVSRELGASLSADLEDLLADPKTRLQEFLQARGEPPPSYQTVSERGPDHSKQFEVRVSAGERALGSGVGPSKRAAEQDAARAALRALEA